MLILPKGTDVFVVYYGASRVGLGCVLMKHSKVVAYASKHLKVYERINLTHEIKSASVVFALKRWHHYVYGVHVDIYLNHKSLQYMFMQT